MERLGTMLPTTRHSVQSIDAAKKARAWLDAHLNDSVGHLNEKDGIDCPICHNTGLLYRRSENGELISRECECKKERRKVKTEQTSGISDDWRNKTFDTYETEKPWQADLKTNAISFTQRCIDGATDWFYLGGQPGSGKTHLAKAIFQVLLGADKRVRYMSWKDDAAQAKALLNSDGYQPFLKKYKQAEILFIDDFLKTRREANGTYRVPTDGDMNIAFEIVKYRDENNLVTVFTSEFTVNAVYGFDQSVGGRIKQRCGVYCFGIAPDRGKDYRL